MPSRKGQPHVRPSDDAATNASPVQEFQRRYHALFEQTGDAIFLMDTNGAVIGVNQRASQMLGYAAEELHGMTFREIVKLEEHDRSSQVLESLLAGKPVPLYERVFRKKDGTEFPVEVNVSLISNEQGEPFYIQSIVRDISARKANEQALRESEERYRSVIASLAEGVILVDEEHIVRAANSSAKKILNRSLDEMVGRPLLDLWGRTAMDEDGHPFLSENLPAARTLEIGQPQTDIVMWIERPNAGRVWVSINTQPLAHPGEKHPHAAVVSFFDITARKKAEIAEREQRKLSEALRANILTISGSLELEEVLDRILESIPSVVPHDNANILLFRDGAVRIARSRGQLEKLDHLFQVEFQLDELPLLKHMAETRRPLVIPDTHEYELWIEVPGTQWIRSYVAAPIIVENEVTGFLNLDDAQPGAFSTVHADWLQTFANQAAIAVHNAQFYEAARQYAAELEDRNAELDAFSHTVAHDLKAPLQIIVGYSDLLKAQLDDRMTDNIAESLELIRRHALKMGQIIDSLLMLAGLREAVVKLGPVVMQPVVEGALMRFQQVIQQRGITVTVDSDLPSAVGYGPWLEEVFANLIGNAVKYIGRENPDPRIAIHGYHEGDLARFEVEDNGLGIAPEHLKQLFEKFSRFHLGEAKGHGLGLSIVLRIVKRLGGQLGVESEEGKGSTFWFNLPAHQPE